MSTGSTTTGDQPASCLHPCTRLALVVDDEQDGGASSGGGGGARTAPCRRGLPPQPFPRQSLGLLAILGR